MAEIKTQPTAASVDAFIEAVENPVRRADARTVCAMMERITGCPPILWGPSIIGFGSYHYTYDSGHEGTMCRLAFSPRKDRLVLYLLAGDTDDGGSEAALLARLGKHKTGKSCLYLTRLADVDTAVLEALVARAWNRMKRRYPD